MKITLRYRLFQLELAGMFDPDSIAVATTRYGADLFARQTLARIANSTHRI